MDHSLGFAGQTVFLTVSLWIMLKLQKLNFNFFGLIGSAALACALDTIPYVGIEVSLIVLLICITKVIGSRTFTDAIFTCGIAYALTFCFNLYVLAILLGDLRHHDLVRARTPENSSEEESASATNVTSPARSGTNAVAVATKEPSKAIAAAPAPAPKPTPIAAAPAKAPAVAARPTLSDDDTNQLTAARQAGEILTHFTVKGISQGAIQTIAVIGNGTNTYDVVAGDLFQVQTAAGKATVKCESADGKKVILSVEGVKVTLLVRQ